MPCPLMLAKLDGLNEIFVAVRTLEGLVASVDALMSAQVTHDRECLVAICTLIGLFPAVSALMRAKVASLSEHLAALRTLVGLVAGVDALVRAKFAGLSELLVAMCTLIGLLSAVCSLMPAAIAAIVEHAATLRTCERTLLLLLISGVSGGQRGGRLVRILVHGQAPVFSGLLVNLNANLRRSEPKLGRHQTGAQIGSQLCLQRIQSSP